MAWTAPRDWTVGETVTEDMMDEQVKGNMRYLKGLDGLPTIESGLIIDNTDGDEYVKLPLLSTAEAGTVLDAEGKIAFDETTHQLKLHNGTAVKAVISEADVDDTPVNGADTVPVSSNWAYDYANIITTAGDLRYATAAGVDTRLGIGTIGHILSVAAGGTAPEWRAETARTNKLDTETRDMTAATGDVAYTGYGFQPTSLFIIAGPGNQGGTSIGFADVNLLEGCFFINGADGDGIAAKIINIQSGGGADQTAVLKTLDADGFTLTWTKTGSPTGTSTFYVLALR